MPAENITAAPAPLPSLADAGFSPQQVKLIEQRLDGLTNTIYLVANLASIAESARREDDIELATVLWHMSGLLTDVAGRLDVARIIPYAEREKAVAHGEH